jgi:predicted 3-demethylubiquinone-9 3-methyltransferase (glyoxalase superfamily)
MQKIVPHLWYVDNAEEAARFYASIFPDSRVDRVTAVPADTPSGPAGSVTVVEFTSSGRPSWRSRPGRSIRSTTRSRSS